MLKKKNGPRKLITISMCFFLTNLLVGCEKIGDTQQAQGSMDLVEIASDEKLIANSDYKDKLDSMQIQTETLNEQNQYLVSVIKQLTENLTEQEMLDFSQNQFVYELKINGEPIPKNGELTITANPIEILLVEKGLGYNILPDKWVEKGRISGDYISHILNFDTLGWTQTGLDGTVNSSQGYIKADVKSGEHITFNISHELKERLKLDTDTIKINVV